MRPCVYVVSLLLVLTITASAQIPTNGLVAYYPCNGNVNDGSGNGNDGTLYGATFTNDRFGMPDRALLIDGSSGNWVGIPNMIQGFDQLSISMWVKEYSLTFYHGEAYISFGAHQSVYVGIGHYNSDYPDGNLSVDVSTPPDGLSANIPFESAFRDVYQHYVLAFDRISGTLKSYRNGSLINSSTGPVGALTFGFSDAAIGKHYWDSGYQSSTRFNGEIDDIRIYNRPLNEQEIVSLYNEGGWTGDEQVGTTIITHGLCLYCSDVESGAPWCLEMAHAIAERLGGGQVYVLRSQDIVHRADLSVGTGGGAILVFDWTEDSFRNEYGYSEAAGDALAALLLRGATGTAKKWSLSKLHFIGHSRGTVVNSEAIERLGMYSSSPGMLPPMTPVDTRIHVTLLDPHPWDNREDRGIGDPFTAWDYNVNSRNIDEAVVCWGNVAYADNYFQTTDSNLDGLQTIVGCTSSKDLSQVGQSYIGMDHSGVHRWYLGTIDHSYAQIDPTWYASDERTTLGYNNSRAVRGVPAGISTSGTLSISADLTVGRDRIFNGEFTKTNHNTSLRIPGWDFHGGGGAGYYERYFMSKGSIFYRPHLKLFHEEATRLHNVLYVPADADSIYFRMMVTDAAADRYLQVFADDGALTVPLGTVSLTSKTETYWRKALSIGALRGATITIGFALLPAQTYAGAIEITDLGFSRSGNVTASVSLPSAFASMRSRSRYESRAEAFPVTFHAYDSQGNHTGSTSDSTWEEGIPGSSIYAESDTSSEPRRTIVLPSPEPGVSYSYRIVSEGGSGHINFQIEDATGDGASYIAAFDSVAIAPSTIVTAPATPGLLDLSLGVDDDGDGLVDTTITPSELFGTTAHVDVDNSWNLISVPVQVADERVSTLYPNAITKAFSYSAGYQEEAAVLSGFGYWLKFPAPEPLELSGLPLLVDSVAVVAGWNIVGSLSSPVPVASLFSEPPGMITTEFYGYSQGYSAADTIFPGRGYWVKVNQTGTIVLSSGGAVASTSRIQIMPTSEVPPPPPVAGAGISPLVPSVSSLAQNYPNPFNPTTTIKVGLPSTTRVKLTIFNTLGQSVACLFDGQLDAGYREFTWDASNAASGLYFYRLEAIDANNPASVFVRVKKMTLIR